MKQKRSPFGTFLMVMGGIFILTMVIVTPSILKADTSPLWSRILAILFYMALSGSIIGLGHLLRRKAKKKDTLPHVSASPTLRQSSPPLAPTAKAQKSEPPQPSRSVSEKKDDSSATMQKLTVRRDNHVKKPPASSDQRKPKHHQKILQTSKDNPVSSHENTITGNNDKLCLFRNPKADTEALHTLTTVYRDIWLEFREGTPTLFCDSVTGTEYGLGKFGVEPQKTSYELPTDLRAGLTPEALMIWITERIGRQCPGPWADLDLQQSLSLWCGKVRYRATVKLPDCVYLAENPFRELDNVGPEGLNNESGILYWVHMKEKTKVSSVIDALADLNYNQTIVVLVEKAFSFSGKNRMRCLQSHIWFGMLTSPDTIIDFVSAREYRVGYQEWPGSADDSATYGRWWLSEMPPSDEARLVRLIEKITADCRELGVDEKRITHLLDDELNMIPKGGAQHYLLSIDENTGKYVIDYYERGSAVMAIEEDDEMEFRFEFLRIFVYHCSLISKRMKNPEYAEALFRDTEGRFAFCQSYKTAYKKFLEAFPAVECLGTDDDATTHGRWWLEKVTPCPIMFGHYPQAQKGTDRTPVQWHVIAIEDRKALLLAVQGLECRPFAPFAPPEKDQAKDWENLHPLWETSPLRAWLNGEFLQETFSTEEQSAILETELDNTSAHQYEYNCRPTRDRVFLLNWSEASETYLHTNAFWKCRPTAHAAAQVNIDPNVLKTWALRSTGYEHHNGTHVVEINEEGRISFNNYFDRWVLVRPAVWVDMNADCITGLPMNVKHE